MTAQILFDSRIACATYRDEAYYRSSSFVIEHGSTALLELTTAIQYYEQVSFDIIRSVAGNPEMIKPYRAFDGQTVKLGVNGGIRTQAVVIDRAGTYYIAADKAFNRVLLDNKRPTIIELFQ